MSVALIALLVLYQLKHFLADYPLQRPWMLKKFLPGWGFVLPLLAHSLVHGAFTYVIALLFGRWEIALLLAAIDTVVHFTMDRIKASPKYLGRFKPLTAAEYPKANKKQLAGNRWFWHSIGIDQMVHHLTHYFLIYLILK